LEDGSATTKAAAHHTGTVKAALGKTGTAEAAVEEPAVVEKPPIVATFDASPKMPISHAFFPQIGSVATRQ
jgi:hypothetical protein